MLRCYMPAMPHVCMEGRACVLSQSQGRFNKAKSACPGEDNRDKKCSHSNQQQVGENVYPTCPNCKTCLKVYVCRRFVTTEWREEEEKGSPPRCCASGRSVSLPAKKRQSKGRTHRAEDRRHEGRGGGGAREGCCNVQHGGRTLRQEGTRKVRAETHVRPQRQRTHTMQEVGWGSTVAT